LTPPGPAPIGPAPNPLASNAPPPPADAPSAGEQPPPTQDFQALTEGLPVIRPAAPPPVAEGSDGVPLQPPPREPPPAPKLADIPDRPADQVKPLDKGPAAGLTHATANGPQPVVAKDGRRPWKVYAGPFKPEPDKKLLAVVVTDIGLADEATVAAQTKLPGAVTLAINPYGRNLERISGVMRAAGHEVMVMLPMEPPEFPLHDAGPMSLLTRHTPVQALERLEKVMGRTVSYVGVTAITPSPVLVSEVMRPVLLALDERGLIFVGAAINAPPGLPVVPIDIVVDDKPFRAAIEARFKQALELLEKQGRAVLSISATPLGVERLYHFLRELPSTVQLVPVTALVQTAEPPKGTTGG
ncbi:MAG: divergent polysaccharide deacetylase family protein, partial [Alphaproteobacteria bacterium]|nr:divergent polysaccharide deacetylase family protein [Alphaproteobacteria bacterium]